MIGNKISDKSISLGKTKNDDKTKKIEKIYIPPRQQIIDNLKLFWT